MRAPAVVAPLGTVESRFAHGGEHFVRDETWFLMAVDDSAVQLPEPQFEPMWSPLEQGEAAMSNEAERLAFQWARAAMDGKPQR